MAEKLIQIDGCPGHVQITPDHKKKSKAMEFLRSGCVAINYGEIDCPAVERRVRLFASSNEPGKFNLFCTELMGGNCNLALDKVSDEENIHPEV